MRNRKPRPTTSTAMVLAIVSCLIVARTLADSSRKQTVVSIPDGLYFFQPYAGDEYEARGKFDKDTYRPLVLVKGGELHDPFVYNKRHGIGDLIDRYVKGRVFDVHRGPMRMGELHKLAMWTCSSNEKFMPDIFVKGDYRGAALPSVPSPTYSGIRLHEGLKVVVVPQGAAGTGSNEGAKASDTQELDLVKSIKASFGQAARARESVWVDIDGDGILDAIARVEAIKELLIVFTKKHGIETVGTSTSEMRPEFVLGGIIDVDLDGNYEIIVQRSLAGPDLGEFASQIEIYRRSINRWEKMYSTAPIWCAR